MRRNIFASSAAFSQSGFTLIELIVTMSAFLVLVTLATLNLAKIQRTTSVGSVVDKLVTDLKSQQLKAMNGDTEGQSGSVYTGIYFESSQYTLFHGSSYTPGDSNNFVVSLTSNIQITNVTLPFTVLFTPVSGEVAGYVPTTNTIVITDGTTGLQRTVYFNKYGTVTQVN